MPDDKKVFVSIYCKLPDDCFSSGMVNKMATGNEIYNFLMKDAGLIFDENRNVIPGDCTLWYLICSRQYGSLRYKDFMLSWEAGDSSVEIVEDFISGIHLDGLFTDDQYRELLAKCNEGRKFESIYDIPLYLQAKKEGRI